MPSLTPGFRLGAFEILAQLGSGGMGEVYRARDVKLSRDIALKILPDSFTHDPERVARFQREAQILAALNHPHIGAIYGIDEANGIHFLVLELVDGDTLEQRITRGAAPVEEGFRIATEIADALAAAHEKGVVHRDLKPANIALTKDGRVKVLDFGLAKGTDAASTTHSDVTHSPTMQSPAMTGVGMLLGTAAYMSPEQARGYTADRQSDIWAFGCVVYELLTGRRLFSGATVTDTLAAVLTGEPEWARVPARARRLLRRCLERDPKQRLHDISDARFLLDEESTDSAPARSRPWPWLVAALALVALAVALWFLRPPAVDDRELMRLALDLDPDTAPYALADAAISPDGTRIVFYTRVGDGGPLLATRRFDESRVTTLAGTEGADQPFFSPDGQWIGFFAGAKLMKVLVQGGTPIALTDARVSRGASWAEDGTIIAALSNRVGLSRVPADGGEPRPLTTSSQEDPTHRWPQVLPGGKAVLFTANTPTINSYEDATIDVQPLPGQRKTVWRGGYFGRYVPAGESRGHLLYIRHGVLFAAPFDLDRLEVDGPPSPLLEDVAADPVSGAGFFDFSRNGTFVYRSGAGLRPWIVAWLDASGHTTPLLAKPGMYYSPRFSPDGQRLALGIDNGKGMDTFIADLQRDTMSRVTFTTGTNWDPVWAPDGKHLLIRSGSGTGPSVWWARADGGGEPARLLDVPVGDVAANSFSPDGRTWIFASVGSRFDADLWTLSLDLTDADRPKPGKPKLFLDSPGEQTRPAISPDGRWVAYQSNETGSLEVFIRPFSAPASGGPRWQVSTSGGGQPIWSRSARELFFTTGNQIMVADYTIAGDSFVASKPRLWSPTTFLANTGFTALDLAPDGKRFATLQRGEPADRESKPRVTLLLNFFEEIRRRSPAR